MGILPMDKLIVKGGTSLKGEIRVSGAKNAAMKVILAGLLTDEPLHVKNIPFISSVLGTSLMVEKLGVKVIKKSDHSLIIHGDRLKNHEVPLEFGGLFRTATMVLGPLLSRFGKAVVPDPGGCRIGKRPIERHIEGLTKMGADIICKDGYFIAKTAGLKGTDFTFESNTHTGTETLILAAVLAEGETVLNNAAEEPEVDNLILLLNQMGAEIRRVKPRTIIINGVKKLSGTTFSVMPDRNEAVTFAIAAIASEGDLIVEGPDRLHLKSFLEALDRAQARWEPVSATKTRFYKSPDLQATDIITGVHPGFMTDWQAPWALLMTQARGISTVHETIYEDRFGYVSQLKKMGAKAEFFQPEVDHPEKFYNFHWSKTDSENCQAIRISGPTPLHDAILEVTDLRAGATLVIAAIIADGESIIHGVDHIDRGYEVIEDRLKKLGVKIRRIKDSV